MGESLAGWLLLAGNTAKVTAHWARVLRVQTAIAHRGTGIGRSMMTEVSRAASRRHGPPAAASGAESGPRIGILLRRLRLAEVGRWPAALRLSEDDYRDEVLMVLKLQ